MPSSDKSRKCASSIWPEVIKLSMRKMIMYVHDTADNSAKNSEPLLC